METTSATRSARFIKLLLEGFPSNSLSGGIAPSGFADPLSTRDRCLSECTRVATGKASSRYAFKSNGPRIQRTSPVSFADRVIESCRLFGTIIGCGYKRVLVEPGTFTEAHRPTLSAAAEPSH